MSTQRKISYYNSAKDVSPSRDITIREFCRMVHDGDTAATVAHVRAAPDEDEAKARKMKLPAVQLSGYVTEGRRKQAMEEGRFVHSGFIQLDVDGGGLNGKTAEEAKATLASDPHVLCAMISPSGKGAKALFRVKPLETVEEHKGHFVAVEKYILATYGLAIDPSTKDPGRLCFVPSDPECTWNGNAVGFVAPKRGQNDPVSPERTAEAIAKKGIVIRSSAGSEWTVDDLDEMLSRVPAPPKGQYQVWLDAISGAWNTLGDAATPILHKHWPERTPGEYAAKFPDREDVPTILKIYSMAKAYGWKPSSRQMALAARGLDKEDSNKGTGDGQAKTEGQAKSEPPPTPEELRLRAYAMRFDPNETPPPDEMCMVIGDIPIAARGNLTVPQGKSKVGKSAVVSAVLGAAHRGEQQAQGDTLCIEWQGESSGAIVHLDTEQSRADWHSLVCRGIVRSGIAQVSSRLVSLPLVMFSRSERLKILRETLEFEKAEKGSIDLVMIDGVADLCISPNDEAEALELVSKLHAMAQEFDCPIFCVLHENPGSDMGKTRGHLGSELNRKAFANLRIDKDAETSISTLYGTDMRKREIPKEHGFCFGWDIDAEMHTFQGRSAGLKAAQAESKAIEKAREEWEPIFDYAAEKRTNGACPVLTAQEAADLEADMKRTKKKATQDAMRKRMERAEILGVLRRIERGKWSFNRNGQSGHETDKRKMSNP